MDTQLHIFGEQKKLSVIELLKCFDIFLLHSHLKNADQTRTNFYTTDAMV